MNDKDKEAYAIYESTILDREGYLYIAREAWQAACEYKDKSLINGTRMKQMNARIEELLTENAKLRRCVDEISIMVNDQRWNDIEVEIEKLNALDNV